MSDDRRSTYFRAYYLAHREAILAKNRAWYRAHPERPRELARLRRARLPPRPPRACLDCGASITRGLRCPRCRARYRYAVDPAYRARKLAATRAWLARRRAARPTKEVIDRLTDD